ncbi:LOW QUALITY PROTEIN: ras-associating and dilute domain-containing protein-like [Gigantopelta aegis]|uniref:LOW QUALITY PROTEIN: ras-associating and dilute domain-containing protein-like n=1 Tax=Gigantopelta aegis TaxID=1735272 RepID=UPI001B88974A|nr:LOW QUALITY PROTEIN: ras-associating and dilute domain-containing protein-like [Gigantopelta aegis]
MHESVKSAELSVDDRAPGVLKIFGESILPGAEYKSVLASSRSTSQELVKQALERYSQPANVYKQYVLCDSVGKQTSDNVWNTVYVRVLGDSDKPLELQDFWKPVEGFCRRYELHKRSDVIREIVADDTSGINENARKIMISKLPAGAIPYTTLWGGAGDASDDMSKGNSINVHDLSDSNSKAKMSSTFALHPYLLTLRGFDTHTDSMQYPLKSKCTTVGKFKGHPYASEIGLPAPDILPLHCRLYLKSLQQCISSFHSDQRYSFFVEVDVLESARVTINGHNVHGRTDMYAGDVLTVGRHYMFLYKDPTGGHDIPQQLCWFTRSQNYINATLSSRSVVEEHGLEDQFNVTSSEDLTSASFEAADDLQQGYQVSLMYSKEKEDQLVNAITEIHCAGTGDYTLAPAVFFVACLDCAVRKFSRHHISNLYKRILYCIRTKIASLAKTFSSQRYQSQLFDPNALEKDKDPLRHLFFWLSNCVQLYTHLQHDVTSYGANPDPEDDRYAGLHELVVGLEDMISFTFQQTIYSVTKVLYPLISAILDSNPFCSSEYMEKDAVAQTINILQTTRDVASDVRLHSDVSKQLTMYLFFFLSTSMFNRIIAKVSEQDECAYNWTFGVRLQATLSRLEDWAASADLEMDYLRISEKLIAVADLLAMSKHILMRMDWQAFRNQFSPLNEVQLLKLLSNYDLGPRRQAPKDWFPTDMATFNLQSTQDLQVSLSSHPAFVVPKEGAKVDLTQHFPEGLYRQLDVLQNLYGAIEDDNDSGLSVSNTPRVSFEPRQTGPKTPFYYTAGHQERNHPDQNPASHKMRQSHPWTTQPQNHKFNSFVESQQNSNDNDDWLQKPSTQVTNASHSQTMSKSMSGKTVTRKVNSTFKVPPLKLPTNDEPGSPEEPSLVHRKSSSSALPKNISRSVDSLHQTGVSTRSRHCLPQRRLHHHRVQAAILTPKATATKGRTRCPIEPSRILMKFQIRGDIQGPTALQLTIYGRSYRTKLSVNQTANFTYIKQNSESAHNSTPAGLDMFDSGVPRCRRSLPYMQDTTHSDVTDKVVTVTLEKEGTQLGLGLIDGLYTPLRTAGIYVKNILIDSPAFRNKHLQIGDRILAVNGKSIIGFDYQSAMKLIKTSGQRLNFLIAKGNESVIKQIASTKY